MAYNGGGTLGTTSDSTFTAASVYATAAFTDGMIATFTAFQNGAPVGTIDVTLTTAGPILVVFPNTFASITSLTFAGSGDNPWVVLDNLVVAF
jgi:hypothetical protein